MFKNLLINNEKSKYKFNDKFTKIITPNKYYYFKYHVKVIHDSLNFLPKKLKIVLDNNSLQLKKKKKVYLHIPYPEIAGWYLYENQKYWAFSLHDSCPLTNVSGYDNKMFVFKTRYKFEFRDLDITIYSLTLYLAHEIQVKKDKKYREELENV